MIYDDDELNGRFELLSERQKSILVFIEDFIDREGYPPTIREIGEACDIASTSVVNYNLNKLVNNDWLERTREKSRGIRLLKRRGTASAVREVPVRAYEAANVAQVPRVGRITPARMRTSVDLPDPFEPVMASVSPPTARNSRRRKSTRFPKR